MVNREIRRMQAVSSETQAWTRLQKLQHLAWKWNGRRQRDQILKVRRELENRPKDPEALEWHLGLGFLVRSRGCVYFPAPLLQWFLAARHFIEQRPAKPPHDATAEFIPKIIELVTQLIEWPSASLSGGLYETHHQHYS